MISLEQVQLLETKVARAIEYVQRVTEENDSLVSEKASLVAKLESNQKRLDELELLVMSFKEDQGRIEDGIIAALNRLSQFEEAFESGLKPKDTAKPSSKKAAPKKQAEPETSEFFEIAGEDGKDKPNEVSSKLEKKTEDSVSEESDVDISVDGELDIF